MAANDRAALVQVRSMGDYMSAKNLDSAMGRMDPSGKNGVDFPKFAKWCGSTANRDGLTGSLTN